MRRRPKPPGTQLARAGERTLILTATTPVPAVRFRASVLDGTPSGRVEIVRADGTETEPLLPEVRFDGAGLVSVSIVPERDTAISFLPVARASSPAWMVAGICLFFGALVWTARDVFGL